MLTHYQKHCEITFSTQQFFPVDQIAMAQSEDEKDFIESLIEENL